MRLKFHMHLCDNFMQMLAGIIIDQLTDNILVVPVCALAAASAPFTILPIASMCVCVHLGCRRLSLSLARPTPGRILWLRANVASGPSPLSFSFGRWPTRTSLARPATTITAYLVGRDSFLFLRPSLFKQSTIITVIFRHQFCNRQPN
jgi:hypothetical protein